MTRELRGHAAPVSQPRRLRTETGQIVVIVTLLLTALLGFAAFAIDVGHAYFTHRGLQASADAAALAGAQQLPSSDPAVAVAQQYGGKPGGKNERIGAPAVSTAAHTECRSGGAACEPVNSVVVKETATVETSFARIFGIDSFTVSARAVAMLRQGPTPYAIFAYDQVCTAKGFHFNGNDMEVVGAIHSNGYFEINGKNVKASYATSGGPSDCPPKIDGENVDLGGGAQAPMREPRLLPWPRWYTTDEFECDFTAEEFKFNTTGQTIPTGVYCASKLFEANGDNQRGTFTVLAPEIKIDGNGQTFKPYKKDLLFFATGDKEMILDGDGYDWEGVIFHPGGLIKINGNQDSVLTGLIEGLEVLVNGNDFRMNGTGPEATARIIELVE